MSLLHQITEKIRRMRGVPAGLPFNQVAALDDIETSFDAQQTLIGLLVNERAGYRALLCGIAWDYGQNGGVMPNLVLIEWPPDPEPKAEKKVIEAPKGLVSLH